MTENMNQTETLADFVAGLAYEDLPADVIEKCKMCIFHVLGCSFAGYHFPWSQTAMNVLKDMNPGGKATTFVEGLKAPSPDVAFVNAVMAHSNLQEDTDMGSGSHTGPMAVTAALAVGEETGCSGRDLMTAIVIGYDLTGRLGSGIVTLDFAKTFRPTGAFGAFGACGTAARLLGLDHEAIVNALGMAGNLCMGLNQWAYDGADDLFFHAGFATADGIRAAMLGKRGINAAKFIMEGPAGIWAAFGKQPAADFFLVGLKQVFAISRVYFKPIPADACTATPNMLALKMSKERAIKPEEIESIEIRIFQLAKDYPGVDFGGPFTGMTQAKMSVQYGVAAVLTYGRQDQSIYDDFKNPLVNKIAANIELIEDEEFSKNFPRQGCLMNVTMRDGKVITDRQDDQVSFSDDQVVENFKYEAGRLFGDERAREMADIISNLEALDDVRDLTKLYVK